MKVWLAPKQRPASTLGKRPRKSLRMLLRCVDFATGQVVIGITSRRSEYFPRHQQCGTVAHTGVVHAARFTPNPGAGIVDLGAR